MAAEGSEMVMVMMIRGLLMIPLQTTALMTSPFSIMVLASFLTKASRRLVMVCHLGCPSLQV
jgi:hypothetical protein